MKVRCGQCGTMFEADPDAGATAACPECSHEVPIPRLDDETLAVASAVLRADEGFAELARKGLGRKIHVTCGSCGKQLTVGARLAGKRGRCPACRGRIQIPYPEEEEELDLPYLPEAEPGAGGLDVTHADRADAHWQEAAESEQLDEIEIIEGMEPRMKALLITGGVVAVGLAIGLWVGLLAGPRKRPTDSAAVSAAPGDGEPSTLTPTRPQGNGGGSPTRPTPPRTRPAPPVGNGAPVPLPVPPVAAQPVCQVRRSAIDLFASEGYFAAEPGKLYLKVTAEVKAGDEPLAFASHGPDVTIELGGKSVESLGLETGGAPFAGPVRRRDIRLGASERGTFTFLFLVPAERQMGVLKIDGLQDATVGWLDVPAAPEEATVLGTYAERPPRNLEPLLRDPVMAAVQAAAEQTLVVRRARGKVQVRIPQAGVGGPAQAAGGGLYTLVLCHGDDRLPCKLRFADAGRRAILYLSDEPFHQISYERQ